MGAHQDTGPTGSTESPSQGVADDGASRRSRRRGEPVSAEELNTKLEAERDLIEVRRIDERSRRKSDVDHRVEMAKVREHDRAEARELRERERDASEEAALNELYRRAGRSGARARIRADIQRSAEMRALRVAKVQAITLWAGIPVLLAFGAWSTTGVQAGVVRLLHLEHNSPAWWASWSVEPALITIVALIIIGKAVLAASGGQTNWKADAVEWTALGTSLALNILGGWPAATGILDGLGGSLPHSIGPIGCAGTAWLIGLFIDYCTHAEPWEGAPRLADLDLNVPDANAIKNLTQKLETVEGELDAARRGLISGQERERRIQAELDHVRQRLAGSRPVDEVDHELETLRAQMAEVRQQSEQDRQARASELQALQAERDQAAAQRERALATAAQQTRRADELAADLAELQEELAEARKGQKPPVPARVAELADELARGVDIPASVVATRYDISDRQARRLLTAARELLDDQGVNSSHGDTDLLYPRS